MVDSALIPIEDTLSIFKKSDVPEPMEADELFDDFIFNYASDEVLQKQRTLFPLPYHHSGIVENIEENSWEHDNLFFGQNYYTLLFEKEEDMELIGDTSLNSVQMEWISLEKHTVKKYDFQRNKGMWMLVSIEQLPVKERKDVDFINFYTHFVTDSIYQSQHICTPLQFVTIDPDDEFSVLETTLDVNQWYAFRPMMPVERLSNICYGQKNNLNSDNKILKVNGIGNGYSNIFYFRKRNGEWELYKYEDTSI